MKCWNCNEEMIWGGDFEYADYGLPGNGIISNFSCNGCEGYAEFYLPLDEDETPEESN